ncbi:TPA: hypothetical protein MPK85_005169 [Salmonella enterica]|nr:hypothetical protein [Salmonella enterica]
MLPQTSFVPVPACESEMWCQPFSDGKAAYRMTRYYFILQRISAELIFDAGKNLNSGRERKLIHRRKPFYTASFWQGVILDYRFLLKNINNHKEHNPQI